jgi:hypothetical protein
MTACGVEIRREGSFTFAEDAVPFLEINAMFKCHSRNRTGRAMANIKYIMENGK